MKSTHESPSWLARIGALSRLLRPGSAQPAAPARPASASASLREIEATPPTRALAATLWTLVALVAGSRLQAVSDLRRADAHHGVHRRPGDDQEDARAP